MPVQDNFTAEEWNAVTAAPMVVSFAITAADPGGLVGTVQEATATARSMGEARKDAPEGSLIAEVVDAFATSEGRGNARAAVKELMTGRKPPEATGAAVARLGETMRLVETKTPEDAPAFRIWLRDIAQKVAEAGTEGGFLGFGGEKVSDAERKTLSDIDAVLG